MHALYTSNHKGRKVEVYYIIIKEFTTIRKNKKTNLWESQASNHKISVLVKGSIEFQSDQKLRLYSLN